jgi:hypothetical protein
MRVIFLFFNIKTLYYYKDRTMSFLFFQRIKSGARVSFIAAIAQELVSTPF